MKRKEIAKITNKKEWEAPLFYNLKFKKSQSGSFEGSYEDDRYTAITSP